MIDPYLSFIIPTLNEEQFLPALLTDLTKQKEKNFEVIVIDGDSDDQTGAAADKFLARLPIRFFSVKKRNVAHQRNYGAERAGGQYLVFLDADSRIDSRFAAKLIHSCRSKKSLIFIPVISPQERLYNDVLIFKMANFFIEASQVIGQPISSGGSMIFQKDYFCFLGGFDEKLFLSEDHEIVRRARQSGVAACVLKDVVVKVSLRRFKKEGRLDLFKNYTTAWIHYLTKGAISKKLFSYDMGGAGYKKNRPRRR